MTSSRPSLKAIGFVGVFALTLLLASVPAHAVIWVATTGNDTTGNGTSGNPYRTIQKGVNVATVVGETIRVKTGTYAECVLATGPLKLNIVADNPNPALTTIQGNGLCTTVRIGGAGGSLVGFTIQGGGTGGVKVVNSGRVSGNRITGNTNVEGGGVEGFADTCTWGQGYIEILDNEITLNHATNDGGGGHVLLGTNISGTQCGQSDAWIEGNLFQDNTSDDDGGGFQAQTFTASGWHASATVIDNIFRSNDAVADGGGFRAQLLGANDTVIVTDNLSEQNTAGVAGGGIATALERGFVSNDLVIIEHNTVRNNVAGGDGGGVFAETAVSQLLTGQTYRHIVRRNTITGNDSVGPGGGVLALFSSRYSRVENAADAEFLVEGNVITGNISETAGGGLGAVALSNADPNQVNGCIATTTQSSTRIDVVNNLIADNVVDSPAVDAGRGGGVVLSPGACLSSPATINFVSNTVVSNDSDGGSGGIEFGMNSVDNGLASARVSHSIVSGNQRYGLGSDPLTGNSSIAVDYSNVFGNQIQYQNTVGDRTGTSGNVSVDPLYQNAGAGNYHLQLASPMVDAGSRTPGTLSTTDIDGSPRVVDGDQDGIRVVDIGYDEFYLCTDADQDAFGHPILAGDDCTLDNCPTAFNPGQVDCDMDLIGDACDPTTVDADGDGVAVPCDTAPADPNVCGDFDADTCQDCFSGLANPRDDGLDSDYDGLCNPGDPDDDDDGVPDVSDSAPFDPSLCGDADGDTCEDCAGGVSDLAGDGPDNDGDGLCNVGDSDDDNDGVADTSDSAPTNPNLCSDVDLDGCNDCAVGTDDFGPLPDNNPAADGPDADSDGVCNSADPDDDNDSVLDAQDSAPQNPQACRDLDTDTCDDCTNSTQSPAPALLNATFDTNSNGLVYLDDVFRGTTQPTYAAGTYQASGSFSGGGLLVTLGGVNSNAILNMSGGWRYTFTLAQPANLTLSFRYNLSFSDTYETDELGQALLAIDGVLKGQGANDYLAQIAGDAGSVPGTFDTTGWQLFTVQTGMLAAGSHTITLGGFNNKKNNVDEFAEIRFDNVLLTNPTATVGSPSTSNDGADFDVDGLCNAGDPDDDNDGVTDATDPNDANADACGDSDLDTCDDCVIGTDNTGPLSDSLPGNDGPDFDADGKCNAGDPDQDNDGVADATDPNDANADVCGDSDLDTCDDCIVGTDNAGPLSDSLPGNDGADFDVDGLCNAGDPDDDNDGVVDATDPNDANADACGDSDTDTCDDCVVGTDNTGPLSDSLPGNDGPDFDVDGKCNAGDPDDDNDGVVDATDPNDANADACGDSDTDTCDDCVVGTDNTGPLSDSLPGNDGPDFDVDGKCNAGDPDDDNDGVADAPDPNDANANVCGDTDTDTCDDCTVGADGTGPLPDNLPANDGPDFDVDGKCNAGDPDDDNDGIADATDPSPTNADACGDLDLDTCDDCVVGTDDTGPLSDSLPGNDGADFDVDGQCNAGDPDDDNDGIADATDPSPTNADACGDLDLDTCDDCAVGTDNTGPLSDSLPGNDGPDFDVDGQCNAGDADDDNDGVADATDPNDANADACGDTDGDTCDDCAVGSDNTGPLSDSLPGNDGLDFDVDGACNAGDADDDNDGVADATDPNDASASTCGDGDGDTCDDCVVGVDGTGPLADSLPGNDGPDFDVDGGCDAGDTDDDNDGVADATDPNDVNADACGDSDGDTCDDCVVGTDNAGPLSDSLPGNDGVDFEGDGLCDAGDPDDDNDTVADAQDAAPQDPSVCRDLDLDTCDDCVSGTSAPANDGVDFEGDGLCDAGDPDDDNDTVSDAQDAVPQNPNACRDLDLDTCDDCTNGTDAVANDGADFDVDGACNAGDTDDDNDGVADATDPNDADADACGDTDGDTCDDCVVGSDNTGPLSDSLPANDGADFDVDGACNAGDTDDDNDGVVDATDPNDANANACGDGDGDTCDDCAVGVDGTGPLPDGLPGNDGADFDVDGVCNAGDADDDNDGVADATDPNDVNADACGDTDGDLCDDCVVGTDDTGPLPDSMPGNDGVDFEGDGLCDAGDPDDDNDTVADAQDAAPQNPNVCRDLDLDTCEDCVSGTAAPASDGVDFEGDGLCDAGDPDDDNDTVLDIQDAAPQNPNLCGDFDLDTCEDCVSGTAAPAADGPDFEGDGLCDVGDPDDDNDTVSDMLDCAPLVTSVAGPAGMIGPSVLHGPDKSTLRWMGATNSNVYNVYRGTFTTSSELVYDHACLLTEVPRTEAEDSALPAPGNGYYYLIAASNACGGDGSLGTDSAGTPRPPGTTCIPLGDDTDLDGVIDTNDGCPLVIDPLQRDQDIDGVGDACDNCPVANPAQLDIDIDGVGDTCDTCTDFDGDGFGEPGFPANTCADDNCAALANPGQEDPDGDGFGTVCDTCPADAGNDADGDTLCGDIDNCPLVNNASQLDTDGDDVGNACDACTDSDADGFGDAGFPGDTCATDNCPAAGNPSQLDGDGDGLGNACDNCPASANALQQDGDDDGIGDICDACPANPLLACVACPPGTDGDGDGACMITIVPAEFGTGMTYLANSTNPGIGMTWVQPAFTPGAGWQPGTYGVGYETGSGAENLLLTTVPPSTLSVYTRFTFELADPSEIERVGVHADYDDGWVIWINGVEVHRSPEMPTGSLSWNSSAAARDSSNGLVPHYGPVIDVTGITPLVTGTNTVAVGVWNAGTASSDLVLVPQVMFDESIDNCPEDANPGQTDTDGDSIGDACDSCPMDADPTEADADGDGIGNLCDPCAHNPDLACVACPPGTDSDGDGICQQEQVLVGPGTAMKYLPNTSNPALGLTWITQAFVPSGAWQNGTFGVGYDTSGGAVNLLDTTVAPGQASIYTRTTVTIANASTIDQVTWGADYDDGYVLWINGIEVRRSTTMPPGTPFWNTTPAGTDSSNGTVPNFGAIVSLPSAVTLLQTGVNTVAIGVYNSSQGSSDLVMVPRLAISQSGVDTDNCPFVPNPDQTDTDGDGLGDACDGGGGQAPLTSGPDEARGPTETKLSPRGTS